MSASPPDPETLERTGQWARAAEAYRHLCEQALLHRHIDELLRSLNGTARMLQQDGRVEEAEEAALLSWAVAERHQMARQAGRAMNIAAVIRCGLEDFAGAAELWDGALRTARDCGDQEMVGMICQNLGVVANIRGDLREARALYLECIASSIRSGNRLAAMTAYNNLGIVCKDLGEWTEAEIYFGRGIELAEQAGDRRMLVKLYGNHAEPLIRVGELSQARAALDRAAELAGEVGDRKALADVARYRAMIARVEGNYAAAHAHLESSLRVAQEAGMELEHGEALEEMARLRWTEERRGAAHLLLREARLVFQDLNAGRDLARLDRLEEAWREESRPPPVPAGGRPP
jgi:tetratricopeptide (TPR) repeat protein